jgi:hypothetical protein
MKPKTDQVKRAEQSNTLTGQRVDDAEESGCLAGPFGAVMAGISFQEGSNR